LYDRKVIFQTTKDMTEQIIIVNEQDEVIGHKERDTKKPEDIYRVSALTIINSKGQTLLAQRSLNKNSGAGEWGPSAAGIVELGENYLENMIKETGEELGINLTKYNFKKIGKIRLRTKGLRDFFCQVYLLEADIQIEKMIIQEEEVEAIKYIDKSYLEQDIQSNPEKYTKGLRKYVEVISKYLS
jgi:isopentenyldiphosphate isomerase